MQIKKNIQELIGSQKGMTTVKRRYNWITNKWGGGEEEFTESVGRFTCT